MRRGTDDSEYFIGNGESVLLKVTGVKTGGLFVTLAIDSKIVDGTKAGSSITFNHTADFSASAVNSGVFTFVFLESDPDDAKYVMSFEDAAGAECGSMDNEKSDENPHQPFLLKRG